MDIEVTFEAAANCL